MASRYSSPYQAVALNEHSFTARTPDTYGNGDINQGHAYCCSALGARPRVLLHTVYGLVVLDRPTTDSRPIR